VELENVLRDDVARAGLTREQALANAPEQNGEHFVVPAVLDDGSDD
jgi:aspartyl-tRNA(Asn)/glutamyl-tRNA(Gln) amidotransferase subunit C